MQMFDEDSLTYDDARQYCTSLGGRLLEVRTQDEVDRAAQLFDQQYSYYRMMIGGRYDSGRAEWIWSSNSEAINLNIFSSTGGLNLGLGECLLLSDTGDLSSYNCDDVWIYACDSLYI